MQHKYLEKFNVIQLLQKPRSSADANPIIILCGVNVKKDCRAILSGTCKFA